MANGYLCGVPAENCSGSVLKQTSSGLKGKKSASRFHVTSIDAHKCMGRHLVRDQGCTQIGQREFASPDGGPVHLLSKKSKFGGKLRMGKNEKGQGSRLMPKGRIGGLIF